MNHAMSNLVEKACRHWEAQRRAAAAKRDLSPRASHALTIAISREAGTQGTSVAKEVGRQLGWHVYDHELLECIAQDMGLRTSLLESVDERQQGWLLETAEAAFLSAPEKGDWVPLVTESGYVHHLIKVVLALGLHGECVIVGRGAAFILPAETTLRVRLIGSVRERIATWSCKLAISKREAARQVRMTDHERIDFVQNHFFKDPNDPRNYDLVLNAPRLSLALSAQVIVETLRGLLARSGAMPRLKRPS
jgi:cytidylate kinase